MNKESIAFWIPRFVVEARKENGDHYPPQSLYALCCGLLRNLRISKPGVNFFSDPFFCEFQQVLDSQMKTLQATGEFRKRQSDIITTDMESRLWGNRSTGGSNARGSLKHSVLLCWTMLCTSWRG